MPRHASAFALTRPKGRWTSWDDLASWLASELDLAMGARAGVREEIAYAWAYYEQQRMRTRKPWPDAADLPSPMAAEYTDAVHARVMQTIFVEPVWTVEGWGESAARVPFVEEFHQRAQEDERLQAYADEWILRGIVEGVGTLKVSESITWRREQVTTRVALLVDEATGQPVMGTQGPELATGPDGAFVEVDPADQQTPSAEATMDALRPARLGPAYEVVPYSDFLTLPGHARHRDQIWGYASRFFRRLPELRAAVGRGMYDRAAVEGLPEANDRAQDSRESPAPSIIVVDQQQTTAQKELYECQVLLDLDGGGERWWVLTLHKETRTLLRATVDDGMTRYIRWMPFPKPGTVDHGYSLIGHKLISVIEEDTARRNMKADRMALAVGAPILRRQGALWDPEEQPFGPRSVLDVHDASELQQMVIADVPQSVHLWGAEIRGDADRLIGQNDTALGVDTTESRTLGEVQLRAGYAEVRINVIVKRMQEALEELGLARHAIWKRTLRAHPDLPPQRSMVIGQSAAGIEAPGFPEEVVVTAALLEGIFWFKPRGSVESADLQRQKANLLGLLQVLPALAQMNPAFAAILGTLPAAKSFMEQALRVFQWPDRQSILGSEAGGMFQQLQQQQELQAMEQQMLADPRMRAVMALAGGMPAQGGMPAGAGAPQDAPGMPAALVQ